MESNRIINLIYLIVFLLVQFSCSNEKNRSNKENVDTTEIKTSSTKENRGGRSVQLTKEQYVHTGIVLGGFVHRNLKTTVRASGYLKLPPQRIASASTFMGGVVKKIYVIEGNYVNQGQLLAVLQHPDFIKLQEEYLKTRANLGFLEKEYNRQKELYQENVSAGKVFQQTEASYKSERDRLTSLKDQIEMLGISLSELNEGKIESSIPVKAPIQGYISKININTGSYAEPIKQLFEVVDNSHIHVDLMVYEKDWYKVKIGNKILFKIPNRGDKEVEGVVFAVGKSFDEKTKSLAIHAEIPHNEKYGLVPGIYVTAVIDVGASEVTALPDEAIVNYGGLEYIFIQEENDAKNKNDYHFHIKEVKTGVSQLGYTEVSPLEPIDSLNNIVVKGTYYLLSKLKASQEEGSEE